MLSQLLYGPLAATYTTLVGCSIIFLRGNIFGAVFKVISELATVFGYAAHRRGAVLSTITASVSRVTVMTVVNYYLLQLFYKMPEAIVVGLLFPIAIFNLTQAIINILPAYLIYQRLRPSEQNKHIKSKAKASPDKKSQSTSPI
jgi:riboflavin transporter FmnP